MTTSYPPYPEQVTVRAANGREIVLRVIPEGHLYRLWASERRRAFNYHGSGVYFDPGTRETFKGPMLPD